MCHILQNYFFEGILKEQFQLQKKLLSEINKLNDQKKKTNHFQQKQFLSQNCQLYEANQSTIFSMALFEYLNNYSIKLKNKKNFFSYLSTKYTYDENKHISQIHFTVETKHLKLKLITKLQLNLIKNSIQIKVLLGQDQGYTCILFKHSRKELIKKIININKNYFLRGIFITVNRQNGSFVFRNSTNINLRDFIQLFYHKFNLKNLQKQVNLLKIYNESQNLSNNLENILDLNWYTEVLQNLFYLIKNQKIVRKNIQKKAQLLKQIISNSIDSVEQIIKNQIPQVLYFDKKNINLNSFFLLHQINRMQNSFLESQEQELQKLKVESKNYNKTLQKIWESHIYFGFSIKAQEGSFPNLQKAQNQRKILKSLLKNIKQQLKEPTLQLFYQNQQLLLNSLNSNNLSQLYEPSSQENTLFSKYLKVPIAKITVQGQNRFIFNFISINNPQKMKFKKIFFQDGFPKIQASKMSFSYLQSTLLSKTICQQQYLRALQHQKYSDKNNSYQSQKIYQTESFIEFITSKSGQKNIYLQKQKLDKLLAVKSSTKGNKSQKQLRKFQNQKNIVKLLKNGSSGYILKYYVSCQKQFQFKNQLLMDFLPESLPLSVFSEIHKQSLSLSSKIHLLINISNSIRFINDYQIAHLDISLNNILIIKDFMIKLIDFGEAFSPKLKPKNYSPAYTIPFCAPQIFDINFWQKFNSKQDIFSFGIILYYLFFEDFPFFPTENLQKAYKQSKYERKLFLAPQRIQAYADNSKIKVLNLILNIFFKCIHFQAQNRCQPSWTTILFKILYFSQSLNNISH